MLKDHEKPPADLPQNRRWSNLLWQGTIVLSMALSLACYGIGHKGTPSAHSVKIAIKRLIGDR
ncbi:hypothetical protein J7643_15780 [bacterium]|nr:hypothetical protein [bacterium]